jgi:ankyrin repeat protein
LAGVGLDAELFKAVRSGDVAKVRELLRKRANSNIKDELGWTLLHYAAANGYADVAKLLLEYGADMNARDASGWTPLHIAAANGYMDVAILLLEHGANVNARDEHGWTPLHEAAYRGHLDVVKLLLEYGGDPSVKDNGSKTPLDVARMRGNEQVARVVEEHVKRGKGEEVEAVAVPSGAPALRELAAPSIVGVDCSNLYVGEWGRLVVRVRGSGTAFVSLEGDVEWLDPGGVKLSCEGVVEVPVRPRVAGEIPVKVTVKSASGDEVKIVWLKVVEKARRCPSCGVPVEPGAKYCWRCGARLD